MYIIMVHGSVETSCDKPFLEALQEAALAGYAARKGGLLDAAEKTVIEMEDSPLFNAGYGSVLNLDGDVEMDASIMDGVDGNCGAVGAIKDVKNPISVARKVMEKTDHVLLAGVGATKFARKMGYPNFNSVTDEQKKSWEKAMSLKKEGKKLNFSAFTGLPKSSDTVGCIAYCDGETVAASSTGGSFLKLPGRIGDTPIFGGGIYASPYGAAVCTGRGEAFIEIAGASRAINHLANGLSAEEAATEVIKALDIRGDVAGGILVVDSKGNAAAVYNASQFPVALVIDGNVVEDFTPINIR